MGSSSLANLKQFTIKGESYELPVDDGEKLLAAHKRLSELKAQIEKEESQQSVEYRSIPAAVAGTTAA